MLSVKSENLCVLVDVNVCVDCVCVFPAISKSLTFPVLVSNYTQPSNVTVQPCPPTFLSLFTLLVFTSFLVLARGGHQGGAMGEDT